MPLDKLQSNWHFEDVKRSIVLDGKGLKEFVKTIFNLLWSDYLEFDNWVYWKKPDNPQMWTVTDVDRKWFLANLLLGGRLDLVVRGPKGHGWKDFNSDYNHWTAILQKDNALPQTKKREKGIYIKGRKTRSSKKNFIYIRTPHL